MSDNPNESLPPLSGEYHPGFADLLRHMNAGPEGLFEFTEGRDGCDELMLGGSRTQHESTYWMNAEGQPVMPFNRKFETDFAGWQPGDIVGADYMLSERNGTLGFLPTDEEVGDIREADFFALTHLSEEQQSVLRQLGVATVHVDLCVTGPERTYTVSSSTYEASIHHVHTVQRQWDGETALSLGQQALIQGEVIAYNPTPVTRGNADFPTATIRLSNGREVDVAMIGGYINYDSGQLDVIHPRSPQLGDTIQLNATYGSVSTGYKTPDTEPLLHAEFCRTAHLRQPSPERRAAYEACRTDVAARIEALAGLEGQTFRKAYGELLSMYIQPEASEKIGAVHMLLSPTELLRLEELVQQKFPDMPDGRPTPDKPLGGIYRKGHAVRVNEAYGVNVFAMSRAEFYSLCLEIANGRLPSPGPEQYQFPFWLMRPEDGDFTLDEQEVVFQQAVAYYSAALAGKEVVNHGAVADPATQASSVAEWLLEESTYALGNIHTQRKRQAAQPAPAQERGPIFSRTPEEMDQIIKHIITDTLGGEAVK